MPKIWAAGAAGTLMQRETGVPDLDRSTLRDVKPVRWLSHAVAALADREIDRVQAELAVAQPEVIAPGDPPSRRVLMRRYADAGLQREMLLRIVVEETADEIVVVTLYKTSRVDKYLKGSVR